MDLLTVVAITEVSPSVATAQPSERRAYLPPESFNEFLKLHGLLFWDSHVSRISILPFRKINFVLEQPYCANRQTSFETVLALRRRTAKPPRRNSGYHYSNCCFIVKFKKCFARLLLTLQRYEIYNEL